LKLLLMLIPALMTSKTIMTKLIFRCSIHTNLNVSVCLSGEIGVIYPIGARIAQIKNIITKKRFILSKTVNHFMVAER